MELGLSLRDSTRPFLFMDKPVQASSQLGLGFNTTLSIGPRPQPEEEEEQRVKQRENQNSEEHDEQVSKENHSLSPKNHNPLQLDLLLHTTVVARSNLPWPPASENGCSAEAAGSSRVLDVNRLPAAARDEEAEEGSSLNSAASSIQMDLCIYGRGRSLSGSGNCNGKRDHSDGEAYDQRASSRASDEDDNGGGTRKKLRLSKEQSAFLEESFKEHNTLNPKQKLALADQLKLRPRQVEVWFQNRRARTKLKQTEVDCEYLKRCCETLTEENRRLHKELQELRALKTNSNPFYMQLPATTLTMCPSCERVATNSATTSPATASTAAMAATATATATTKAAIETTSPKAIEFPIGKPRFYPFAHTQPHYPHQSTAS